MDKKLFDVEKANFSISREGIEKFLEDRIVFEYDSRADPKKDSPKNCHSRIEKLDDNQFRLVIRRDRAVNDPWCDKIFSKKAVVRILMHDREDLKEMLSRKEVK